MNAGQEIFGPKGGAEGKILVMEDEAGLARALQMNLSEEGYEVEVVTTVQNALEQLQRKYFDLLVVDLCLPEVGGMAFIKKVRREQPDTEVIVTTANPSVSSVVEAMKLGAKEYLAKPFTEDEFKNIVVSTLKKRRKKAVANARHDGKQFGGGALIRKREVLAVLELASEDEQFLRNIMEEGFAALEDSTSESEAKAAIIRGDLGWLERCLGELTPKQLWLIKKICGHDG
jgi:DNA-binding NtrC family response regulator